MKKHDKNKPDNSILAIATILAQTLFIAILNLQLYLSVPENTNLKGFLPFANVFIIFLCAFAIISIKQITNISKKEAEVHLLKNHLNQVQDLVRTIHVQQHEHARHIQTLQSMLFLDEYEEAEAYLDGLTHNYPVTNPVIYLGDLGLSILIHAKQKVAETNKVKFDHSFQYALSKCGIPSWDLCSIVGNLVDNAIEAAIAGPQPGRVTIETKDAGVGVQIDVHNSGKPISTEISGHLFEDGFTTKDSAGRGYGLYLVKKLVNKYKGTVSFTSSPKTITFTVWLPGKEDVYLDKNLIEPNSQKIGTNFRNEPKPLKL